MQQINGYKYMQMPFCSKHLLYNGYRRKKLHFHLQVIIIFCIHEILMDQLGLSTSHTQLLVPGIQQVHVILPFTKYLTHHDHMLGQLIVLYTCTRHGVPLNPTPLAEIKNILFECFKYTSWNHLYAAWPIRTTCTIRRLLVDKFGDAIYKSWLGKVLRIAFVKSHTNYVCIFAGISIHIKVLQQVITA